MSLTLPPATRLPRFILFGNLCYFTTVFLQRALDAGFEVAAIALPGLPAQETPHHVRVHQSGSAIVLPSARTERLTDFAQSASVPIYRVGRVTSNASVALLQSLEADYLLSVCFPRRIPMSLVKAVKIPALNVHPSMLPLLRGPDPMFWTFYEGSGRSGVTVHHLTSRFDAGPIASQQEHKYVDGTSEHDLESELARLAVGMLQQLQPAIVQQQLPAIEQPEDEATYARFPLDDDYRVQSTWTARRAYNFASGVISRGVPITVDVNGIDQVITKVYAFKESKRRAGPGVWIRMADGFLVADVMPAAR